MPDIELVIKIDEEIYKSSKKECAEKDSLIIDNFTLAIGNGILLSEELKKIKAETIIDELEKIRAEITEYRRKNNCGVLECLGIIDKEVKGARRSLWR